MLHNLEAFVQKFPICSVSIFNQLSGVCWYPAGAWLLQHRRLNCIPPTLGGLVIGPYETHSLQREDEDEGCVVNLAGTVGGS